MFRLNPDDLTVSTFSLSDAPGIEPELTNTDPRACPRTQGWDCDTRRCPVEHTIDPGCLTG